MRLPTKFQASRTILQLILQLKDTCPGGWDGTDSDYGANLSSTETAAELQLELSLAKKSHMICVKTLIRALFQHFWTLHTIFMYYVQDVKCLQSIWG